MHARPSQQQIKSGRVHAKKIAHRAADLRVDADARVVRGGRVEVGRLRVVAAAVLAHRRDALHSVGGVVVSSGVQAAGHRPHAGPRGRDGTSGRRCCKGAEGEAKRGSEREGGTRGCVRQKRREGGAEQKEAPIYYFAKGEGANKEQKNSDALNSDALLIAVCRVRPPVCIVQPGMGAVLARVANRCQGRQLSQALKVQTALAVLRKSASAYRGSSLRWRSGSRRQRRLPARGPAAGRARGCASRQFQETEFFRRMRARVDNVVCAGRVAKVRR